MGYTEKSRTETGRNQGESGRIHARNRLLAGSAVLPAPPRPGANRRGAAVARPDGYVTANTIFDCRKSGRGNLRFGRRKTPQAGCRGAPVASVDCKHRITCGPPCQAENSPGAAKSGRTASTPLPRSAGSASGRCRRCVSPSPAAARGGSPVRVSPGRSGRRRNAGCRRVRPGGGRWSSRRRWPRRSGP